VVGFDKPAQRYIAWLACPTNKTTFKVGDTGLPNPSCSYKNTLVPQVKYTLDKSFKGKYLVAIVLFQNADGSYVTTLTNFVKITK